MENKFDINNMTIGQLKEVQTLIGQLLTGGTPIDCAVGEIDTSPSIAKHEPESVDKGRYIVIGNRGNIVVGDLVIKGSFGYLSNASVIRRWGTSRGLGQLALDGKQPETVLDKCGDFEFHIETSCGMIPVKSDL